MPKTGDISEDTYRDGRVIFALELAKAYAQGVGVQPNLDESLKYLKWVKKGLTTSLARKTNVQALQTNANNAERAITEIIKYHEKTSTVDPKILKKLTSYRSSIESVADKAYEL